MVMEIWDYVNSLFRKLRGDASGRAVTLPEGQYLATPGVLADEEYHHLTLTVDKKLRTDDPTTQAAIADLDAKIDIVQVDLDNPDQYKAVLTTLETRLSALRAGYLDQLDFAIQEAITALQTDLDNPAQYKADLSTLETRLSAARAGYIDQLDFALQEAIAAIPTTMVGTNAAALAAYWTETRAGYIDQLDFALQEAIAAIPTTAMRGTDNALLAANYVIERGTNDAMLAASYTAERGTDSAALAVTLEDAMQKATTPAYNQDTDSQEAIREAVDLIPTTAMRGTDAALLAASYTAERGTDSAALATSLTTHDTDIKAYVDKIDDATDGLTAIKAEVEGLAGAAMRGTDSAMLAASYTAERGTDNAALAAVCTEPRLAELDAANIPANIDTIAVDVAGLDGAAMRGTDSAALASVCTEVRLAELGSTKMPADIDVIKADTPYLADAPIRANPIKGSIGQIIEDYLNVYLSDVMGAAFSGGGLMSPMFYKRGHSLGTDDYTSGGVVDHEEGAFVTPRNTTLRTDNAVNAYARSYGQHIVCPAARMPKDGAGGAAVMEVRAGINQTTDCKFQIGHTYGTTLEYTNDSAILFYDSTIGANWIARSWGTAEEQTDTGVAADTNLHVFKIVRTESDVKFYIDNVLKVTHSVQFPNPGLFYGSKYIQVMIISTANTYKYGKYEYVALWIE